MQVQKINVQTTAANNRPQKQNQKSDVSFGKLGDIAGRFCVDNFTEIGEQLSKKKGIEFNSLYKILRDYNPLKVDFIKNSTDLDLKIMSGKLKHKIGPVSELTHNKPMVSGLSIDGLEEVGKFFNKHKELRTQSAHYRRNEVPKLITILKNEIGPSIVKTEEQIKIANQELKISRDNLLKRGNVNEQAADLLAKETQLKQLNKQLDDLNDTKTKIEANINKNQYEKEMEEIFNNR